MSHVVKLEFETVDINVRKRAEIRNRYNQAPHLTQDTKRKVTTSQLDITNESQEVSPFPAGDHKANCPISDLNIGNCRLLVIMLSLEMNQRQKKTNLLKCMVTGSPPIY